MEFKIKIDNGSLPASMMVVAKGKFPKTKRQALRASIAKWECIVAVLGCIDMATIDCGGEHTCALCQLYLDEGDGCEGCPVFEKTGHRDCDTTPFRQFGKTNKSLKHAMAELKFLKSLLWESA